MAAAGSSSPSSLIKSVAARLPRRIRAGGRRALLALTPRRHRLQVELAIERAMGRLEVELLKLPQLASSRDLAIDVGASRGYYSCVMSRLFDRVVAFEPNEEVVAGLAAMRAANVTIHRCALSSSNGTAHFYVPRGGDVDYTGWGSLDPGNFPGETSLADIVVPLRRLDEFGLEAVSLIKIDAEGHEAEVIEGGRDTITRSRPVMIVEVAPKNRPAVEAFLVSLGYSANVFEGGRFESLPGGLVNYAGPRFTFVFLPPSRAPRPSDGT